MEIESTKQLIYLTHVIYLRQKQLVVACSKSNNKLLKGFRSAAFIVNFQQTSHLDVMLIYIFDLEQLSEAFIISFLSLNFINQN